VQTGYSYRFKAPLTSILSPGGEEEEMGRYPLPEERKRVIEIFCQISIFKCPCFPPLP
jgi:hypothetical protein